jgi:hypothetical protein
MRKCILIAFGLLTCLTVAAQNINKTSGIRLGHTAGLTYKKFFDPQSAIEFTLSGRRDGLQITGMMLNHVPIDINFNDQFHLYYGLGAHLGIERYEGYRKELSVIDPSGYIYTRNNYFAMGIDAMIGAEYRLPTLPLTVAIDLKPYFNFVGLRHTNLYFWDLAISVKYIF